MKVGILIPAYQPDEKLTAFAADCVDAGYSVFVINDGSTEGLEIFDEIGEFPGVTVLGYGENHGKGYALKFGIAAMARRGFTGVITADADGQHRIHDLENIEHAMRMNTASLILGSRNTDEMPPRSKTGNRLTRTLFRLLYGIGLSDTQTGLRGIPLTAETLPALLALSGDRYEYEMQMLMDSKKLFPGGIVEVPIETVYLENNKSSHFRPLRDGGRIYAVLLKSLPLFLLSSLLAFGLDYGLFNTFFYVLSLGTVASTIIARIISVTVNYTVNRYGVFRAGDRESEYNIKNYALLAAAILAVNTGIMYFFVNILGLPAFAVKIAVECGLYIISFTVQQRLAAGKKRRAGDGAREPKQHLHARNGSNAACMGKVSPFERVKRAESGTF